MELPTDDKSLLNERAYDWTLQNEGAQEGFLIIRGFEVSGGGFTPPQTDLMIRIPAQYNMTPLDMWYCDPPIRIRETGQFAQASEATEQHGGRTWQRFSRHLAGGTWRPGVDNLRSFLPLIWREFQGLKG